MIQAIDILAIGAHPDDVELGCGGALAALRERGKTFGILDLTRGEAGTRGTPEIRARESAEAARILGATFRTALDLGDGNLRTDRDAELQVIDVVRRPPPRLVFAPHEKDRHPDHVRASRLSVSASFYAGLRSLVREEPAHRPQQVVFYLSSFVAEPSFLVDVTEVFDRKVASIRAYASQFYDPLSEEPRTFISSEEYFLGIEARAQTFGRLANVRHAEAFVSNAPPVLADPVAAFEGYEPGYPGTGTGSPIGPRGN